MTTIDVENLPAADLKARRDELAKALASAPAADLAARYVQARLDAKVRDERLAEQGATLTALQQGLAAATEKAHGLEDDYSELEAENNKLRAFNAEKVVECNRLREESAKALADMKAEAAKALADARTANRHLTDALTKAQALAKARRAVLAKLMSEVAPLLAAEE